MKHVLFLGYGIDPNRTEAVSKNTTRLISQLEKNGVRVSIANIGAQVPRNGIETPNGMFSAILQKEKILDQIYSYIENEKVTHIHDVFVLPLASVIFFLPIIKKYPKLVSIKEVHNFPGHSRSLHVETFIRLLANRLSQLKLVTDAVHFSFSRNFAISKHFAIPFWPAPIIFQRFTSRKLHKPLRICYLGHPLKKKGIFLFPELFRLLAENGEESEFIFTFALSSIGDREAVKEELRLTAQKYHVKIIFQEEVKPEKFFREQDVLVLPLHDQYSATSTPNTILEAMEAGCLVMTTQTRAIEGVVQDGKTGFLFSPHSPSEIVALLEKVINNEALVARITREAREWLEEHFNQKEMSEIATKLYYEKNK